MKLAILSDFHLGYERFEADAFRQALGAMGIASAEADALLLPGDLFDSKIPRPESIAQALEIFRIPMGRAWDARVTLYSARDGRKNFCAQPVIAIPGTHEARHKEQVNPVQVLEKSGFLVNAQSASVVIAKEGEKVAVYGMGGVPESHAKAAIEALAPEPVPGAFNVFMFHQNLRELIPVKDDSLSIDDLPDGFDVYVCGHMHTKQSTRFGEKLLVIPGSTVVTQLRKDDGEGKGFYLLDTASGKLEFREIGSRPFFYKELALEQAGASDAVEQARKVISSILSSGAVNPVIRIKVSGTVKDGVMPSQVQFQPLSKEFSGRAFITIDKSLQSAGLKEKVAELRALREKGGSIRELGLELLRAKLAEKKFSRPQDAAYLFEILSSGKKDAVEKAVDELLKPSA
ncbi:DNA double-strand break repair protein Mre11 [uncultured archaeon]|nr:DNA double-strand break repair protein Mre11 [uncultured archaeon]